MGIALPPRKDSGGYFGRILPSLGYSLEKGGSDQRTTLFLKKSVDYKMKILGKIDIKYTK
jgi:hypothetical protein